MIWWLLACNPDPEPEPEGVNWSEDVQPVVAAECGRCHMEGGLSALPLETYAQASPIAGAIAESVAERRMPPFLADNSGTCQTYQHALWLSAEEQQLFADWVADGVLEGPEREPAAVSFSEGLADPTAVLSSAAPYTPDHSSGDDWRCFVVEANASEQTQYLQAYEVIPERPERVHHVTLFKPFDAQSAAEARSKDSGSGYTCFGDAGVPAALMGAWSPGRRGYRYPEGTGVPVQAGLPLIMQVHYVPDAATGEGSTTAIAVKMAESVDRELYPLWLLNDNFRLEGEQAEELDSQSGSIRAALDEFGLQHVQGDLDILGTAGHMHLLGSGIHAEIDHKDGGESCLLDIPRWNYDWHDIFLLEQPLKAHSDDEIKLDCAWDTTGAPGPIFWGDGVEEEMCVLIVLASPA